MKPAEDSCPFYGGLGLASLSFASGCTDVLTFLKLGNVFTSAMTGNTALLAIELGRGNIVAASRALAALLAFALGVALATKLKTSSRLKPHTHRGFSRLLVLELIFLTGCAALWSASPDPLEGGTVYAVILLSALSMGIQAVAAGSISSGINTIVFTSALVRIVMSITGALSRAEEDSPLVAAIGGHLQAFASYGCGALVAATCLASSQSADLGSRRGGVVRSWSIGTTWQAAKEEAVKAGISPCAPGPAGPDRPRSRQSEGRGRAEKCSAVR